MATTALSSALPEETKESNDNLLQLQEKKLDAALKKKPKPEAPAKKGTVTGANNASTGKTKNAKGKPGKKKAAANADSDANQTQQQSDQAHDALDDKDDANLDRKGADKGKDFEFEDEEVDWESDLDIDGIINRKYDRDPYLTACQAIGVVPVTFISQHLNNHELIMRHHGLGSSGARAFGKVLESNKNLIRLDLTGNAIGYGGQYFSKSLCLNRNITYLNLSSNDLKHSGKEIAEMIAENSSIQILILSKNRFSDQEAIAIAEGIQKNQTLKALDLSHNEIGDIGGISLGQGVANNSNLSELDISWNELRVRGVIGFLNAVKDNSELTNLNISHNGIGDSANLISPFLTKTNVVRFNLGHTRLGESQFAAFLRGLESNRSIQELDVSGNPLSAASLQALFKAIPSCKVSNITIKDIRFTKEISSYIENLRKDANFTIFE